MPTFSSIYNTTVLVRQKIHLVGEEIGLDQWVVFKLVSSLWLIEQLPGKVLWSMGIRKLLRVCQEVEVIKLVYQVLGNIALRLKETCSPMTVN